MLKAMARSPALTQNGDKTLGKHWHSQVASRQVRCFCCIESAWHMNVSMLWLP